MSVPEAKAFSPAPRRTITRSVSSLLASSQMRASSSYIAKVRALRASGRLKVIQATSPRRSCSRSGMSCPRGNFLHDIARGRICLHLPAEDVVRVHGVGEDDGQQEERAHHEERLRARPGGGVPEIERVRDHLGEDADAEADIRHEENAE